MTDEEITFTEISNIGLVTLNRPQALNALTHEMVVELYDRLGEWKTDEEVKAILIKGAGDKAFCAGGDIRKIYEAKNDPDLEIKEFFWDEYRLNRRINNYQKPYIAILDGITMGGGVGVSIHGTYRIATERFVFAMPETSIGFFPDVGGSYLLSRCPGETGTYLGLTGAKIKAADACYLELTSQYVVVDQMLEMLDNLASTNLSSHADETIKEIIQSASTSPGEAPLAAHRETIDTCFRYNTVEEIINALKTQKTEWCDKTVELLLTKSPTSLKVTLEQLRRGKNLSFDECMQMEYRMVMRFLRGHDFFEGVRALIIDKDQKPQWQPNTLEDVNESEVQKYFAPLKNTEELKFT